jgi:hypothetical protein
MFNYTYELVYDICLIAVHLLCGHVIVSHVEKDALNRYFCKLLKYLLFKLIFICELYH